jgi:hypothetical protein
VEPVADDRFGRLWFILGLSRPLRIDCVAASLSLSHKQFGVSYCEIDPMGRAGLLLHAAMASADL